MNISRRYSLLAYTLLKKYISSILPYFKDLKKTLESAYINIPLEEYLATMMMTEILSAPLGFSIGMIVGMAIGMDWFGLFILGFVSMVISAAFILVIFLTIPEYSLRKVKGNIEKFLPYAATHMATIAGTGVPPQTIFQMMGNFKDYGMVSYVCQRITRNIGVFGYDIVSGISEEAKRVPSYKFRDLLWSIVSTIRTGGDLRAVLLEKSKGLMEEQRRIEAKYIEFLSMMAEVYATVFVAGTIIVFVMVSIIGAMGGVGIPVKLLLQAFTYAMIPLASISFIIVIDSTKPVGV